MCACVRACVCVSVCVWLYGAVVCAVDFQSKHCGFDPRRVRFHTSFFSFSISSWLPTAKMCMSEYAWWPKKKKKKKKKGIVTGQKTATGSCVVQDQAIQQWWSIRSALQPDRWCNSGTSTMLAHSRAIIAYGDGCPRSKVCRNLFSPTSHKYLVIGQKLSLREKNIILIYHFPL